MRVAHNHRPNGLGARNENGFLTCAQCGQPCDDPKPESKVKDLVAALEESLVEATALAEKRRAGQGGL